MVCRFPRVTAWSSVIRHAAGQGNLYLMHDAVCTIEQAAGQQVGGAQYRYSGNVDACMCVCSCQSLGYISVVCSCETGNSRSTLKTFNSVVKTPVTYCALQ